MTNLAGSTFYDCIRFVLVEVVEVEAEIRTSTLPARRIDRYPGFLHPA